MNTSKQMIEEDSWDSDFWGEYVDTLDDMMDWDAFGSETGRAYFEKQAYDLKHFSGGCTYE